MLPRYARTRIQLGRALKVGATEVAPYTRTTIVQFPGIVGGLVWNRPVGVLVKRGDGSQAELPIRDVTRFAQMAIVALGFLGGLAAWLYLGRGN